MDITPVAEALATGALFGLSAGLSPGPLLALVISQTLRHGPGQGARIAMAPLLTDVPIVVICTLLVGMVAQSEPALALVALAGAGVVAWLARDTWRAQPPESPGSSVSSASRAGGGPGQAPVAAPRSWTRGAVVNALSPHPWLFWLAVGAPALLTALAAGGPAAAAAFLGGFYLCLVGSKVGIAVIVGRARGRVAGRGYTLTMRTLAVLLAIFAVALLWEGVVTLLGS